MTFWDYVLNISYAFRIIRKSNKRLGWLLLIVVVRSTIPAVPSAAASMHPLQAMRFVSGKWWRFICPSDEPPKIALEGVLYLHDDGSVRAKVKSHHWLVTKIL